jgi:hypothetical protein
LTRESGFDFKQEILILLFTTGIYPTPSPLSTGGIKQLGMKLTTDPQFELKARIGCAITSLHAFVELINSTDKLIISTSIYFQMGHAVP